MALVAYRGTAGVMKIVPIIRAAGVPPPCSKACARRAPSRCSCALQKTSSPITRAKLTGDAGDDERGPGRLPHQLRKQNNLGSRHVNLTMIRPDGTFAL